MERHDSGVEHKDAALRDHYKDWPNAAGVGLIRLVIILVTNLLV